MAQAAPTDWSQFVPPTDGSFTTWEAPPELGLVKRVFELAFTEECSWALGGSLTGIGDPDVYDITYRESYDLATDPDRLARLYRFFCNAGAYNEQHISCCGRRITAQACPLRRAAHRPPTRTTVARSTITIEGLVAGTGHPT